MEALNEILSVLNAWADSDLERIKAIHADLKAQILPRLPKVLPDGDDVRNLMQAVQRRHLPSQGGARQRYGEGPRAMRPKSDPHPEGWGHEGR